MDIFTCGVCLEEFHVIKDFYEHKLKFTECHKCEQCDGMQFHSIEQLVAHQEEVHERKNEITLTNELDGTQLNFVVTGDTDGQLVLDSAILQKLIEISSSNSITDNVHIILKDADSENKKLDNDAEVFTPSSSSEDSDNVVNFENITQSKVYVCKFCNHFSYQESDVFNHLSETHQKTKNHESQQAEEWIQVLSLLPCLGRAEEVADEKNQVLVAIVEDQQCDGEEKLLLKSSEIILKDISMTDAESTCLYYCESCDAYFDTITNLKNHDCNYKQEYVDSDLSEDSANDNEVAEVKIESGITKENSKKVNAKKIVNDENKEILLTRSNKGMKKIESKLVESYVCDDLEGKLDWKKIESEKEAVLSCTDHLFTEVKPEQQGTTDEVNNSETNLFHCNICERKLPTRSEMQTHCLIHTNLKPYRCCSCKYSTKVKGLLIKHLQLHVNEKDTDNQNEQEFGNCGEFKCLLCLEECGSMMNLVVHVRRYHVASDRGYEFLLSLTCEKVECEKGTTTYRCFFCYTNYKDDIECLEHVKSLHLPEKATIDKEKNCSINKIWKCQLCGHTTSYMKPFLKHISKHKLVFNCNVCDRHLLSFSQLQRHLEEDHVTRESNDKTLKNKELTERSMIGSLYLPDETAKRINSIVSKASKSLRDIDDTDIMALIQLLKYKPLSMEIYEHIKESLGSVECHFCGRLFFSQAELKRHDGIHEIEKRHKCHLCDYSSATKDNLSRHIAKIHEKKVLECPNCEYTTMCQTTMWKHKKGHQKQIECTECHKKFDKLKLLRQHMIDCHLDCVKSGNESGNEAKGIASSTFKCPHCSRKFHRSIQEFKRHMWIHQGIKPIKCKLCSYRCRTANHLEVHMRKHSTIKPHQCLECYKDFKSKGSLQYHMQRFHSIEQQTLFSCDKCDYVTAQKGHLKLHQRCHSVVRNFSCKLCLYSSNTLSSLKGHYKKKHKEATYADITEEGNADIDGTDLSNHAQTSSAQTETRVFKCDTCQYKFTNITDFRRHLRVKHRLINFKWDEVEEKVVQ